MTIALVDFWTSLVANGITDAEGCKRMASDFCDGNQGSPPSEPVALAKFLIRSGELTEYQARALLSGRGLRVGQWLLLEDQYRSPLSRWGEAQSLEDGSRGPLFRADAESLSGGRDAWVATHAELTADTLQPLRVEAVAETTLVFSPLPAGESLHVRGQRLIAPADACRIGIDVADALAALHARSLAHGAVRCDRVWIAKDGRAVLLRDPSGPAVRPDDPSVDDGWLDHQESAASYAAPEFLAPDATCTPATDIYSLGCLLYRLVTGRLPVEGDSAQSTFAAQATETPAEIVEAVSKGEAGDPLFRVLAFAMAKNPAARFADVTQLAGALRAIESIVPTTTAAETTRPANQEPAGEALDAGDAKNPSRTKAAKTPPKTNPPKATASQSATTPRKKSDGRPPKTAPPSERKSSSKRASDAAAEKRRPAEDASKSASKKTASGKRTGSKRPEAAPTSTGGAVGPSTNQTAPAGRPKSHAGRPKTDSGQPKAEPRKVEGESPPPPSDTTPDATDSVPATSEQAPPPPVETADVSTSEVAEPNVVTDVVPPVVAETPKTPDAETPRTPDAEPPTSPHVDAPTSPRPASGPPRRRRKKKKSRAPLILGALCVPILMLFIGLVSGVDLFPEEEKPKTRPTVPAVIPRVSSTPAVDLNDEPSRQDPRSVAGYQLVDDERLLWVPPYSAESANAPLQLLPPGPGAIVSVRLADLRNSAPGRAMVEAFSPELPQLISLIEARAKVPADEVRRCTLALHAGQEGWPSVSLAIELSQPMSLQDLTEAWGAAASRTRSGATIYAGDEVDGDAYYVAPDDAEDPATVSRFAVGSVEQISEVAENEGGAIPLPRSLQTLWNGSSEEAELVCLFMPNFLFADARNLLTNVVPHLSGPLKEMLIPDAGGVLVIADTAESNVYLETRLIPSGGISEAAMIKKVETAIASWPDWADGFVVDSVPDASWRLLANRLPFMMRFVSQQARFGTSGGAAVANVYVPGWAAAQVALGTVLAMNTAGGGADVEVVAAPAKPLTVAEMLDRPMSVSFDQESLEFAVNTIVDEFKRSLPPGSTMPPVKIVGGDLEKMGITQNQQIRDFSKSEVPLRAVLTDLVLGANPDKTATGPDDPKQALIWVIAEEPASSGNSVILVTTRVAAEGKYELPAEFKLSDGGEAE